jgi:DNA-directed RNA polymerase specialized sigma24 family protein
VDDDFEQILNDQILSFIRRKAKQLAGKYGFRRDACKDIEQSLILECLQRARRFDARRGRPDHFARHLVKHAVAKLIESQRSRRRGFGFRLCSLDARLGDDDQVSRAGLIATDGYSMTQGWRPAFEQGMLQRLDVVRAIATLPPDLRRICHLLMVLDHAGQVGSVVGISRATLYRRLQEIRAAFSPRWNPGAESRYE